MKTRTFLFAPALLLCSGCAPTMLGDDEVPARATWRLEADPSQALLDPRCAGADCPRYPNPRECDALQVSISADGRLYASCTRGDTVRELSGGPLQGIPYRCSLR